MRLPRLFLCLCLSAGLWFSTTPVNAQVSTRRVRELVDLITNKVEEGDTDQVLMIMIDFVRRDGSATQSYYLSSGDRYRIVAAGDVNRIKDLDLYVSTDNGTEITKDSDDKNVAICTFRASESGIYKFKVKPYKMAEDIKDGFFGLIISRIRE